jgi:outer membrane protein TolC
MVFNMQGACGAPGAGPAPESALKTSNNSPSANASGLPANGNVSGAPGAQLAPAGTSAPSFSLNDIPDSSITLLKKPSTPSKPRRVIAQAPPTANPHDQNAGAVPQTGLTPDQATNPSKRNTGVNPRYQPAEEAAPADMAARRKLEDVTTEATISSGAIFKDEDHVVVKAPMLTALISLDRDRSPYDLDANSSTAITLRDVLRTAIDGNLDIKIAQQDELEKKWNKVKGFAGFLPTIAEDLNAEALNGAYTTPVGVALGIKNPYLTSATSFTETLFSGGNILHTYKQAKHEYLASQYAVHGTLNDVLQQVAADYYGLVLNEVLLQVRIKAVQTAQALVLVNKDLFHNGVNTEEDLLQSQYQLSQARQQLIQQQIARREAAVKLATAINLNPEVDLTVAEPLVAKIQLVGLKNPNELMKVAIENRPELKKYEQLRLAAVDYVKAERGTLLPKIQAKAEILGSGTKVFVNDNNPLATSGLSDSGVGAGPASSTANLSLSGTSSGPKSWTMRSLFIGEIDATWTLGGLAFNQISSINMARADAHKAQLDFNKELAAVYQEVRDSYLNSVADENLIVETSDAVNYGAEELRVAEVRLKDGVGTNLDVVNAQRDYINALSAKANALIQYNIAQTSMLHAIGRTSMDTLTSNVPLKE